MHFTSNLRPLRLQHKESLSQSFSLTARTGRLKASGAHNISQHKELSKAARQSILTSRRLLAFGSSWLLGLLQEEKLGNGLFVTADTDVASKAHHLFPRSTLGNEQRIRVWQGMLDSIPAYQGPFDCAILAQNTESWEELHESLLHLSFLLSPGSTIYAESSALPCSPSNEDLEHLTYDLPLEIAEGGLDEAGIRLKVPLGYAFSQAPVIVEEEVVAGFGRGSKQMGTPTANLRPEALFAGPLKDLPLGVYFGWAQLQQAATEHRGPFKTVLNIGQRPSIQDGEQRTVELFIMHDFPQDFYGQQVKAVLLGFIRPEIRFSGLPSLVRRINTDKGVARAQLELPMHQECLSHVFH